MVARGLLPPAVRHGIGRPARPTGAGASYAARPEWSAGLAAVIRARTGLGLPAVDSVAAQILKADRVLVLTSRAFDLGQLTLPPNVVHVGPQLDATEMPHPWHNPWPGDPTPLVLISLSTTDQGQLSLLKRLLAASAALPIHVLVTLGPSIDATQLHAPPNAVLERFVPHASVLPLTALVVSHAGHGTVIRALRAGVPLVCLPMGRDQADVAMRVDRHGAGLTLSPDAHPEELRTAIERVLDEPSFRQAAQKLADELARESPSRVVDEIEALLSRA